MQTDLMDSQTGWRRFRAGDRLAYEWLIRTHYRTLFDYGMRFSKDREFIKDNIHDFFLNLWERRSRLNETERVKFYLLKAFRHQIFKAKRRNTWVGEEAFDDVELHTGSLEQTMIAEETITLQYTRLQELLAQLTPRQQEVLHLKFYDNLTYEEIAEVLHISRPAVYNISSAALRELRQSWGAYHGLLVYIVANLPI